MHNCVLCGREFSGHRGSQRYCSCTCANRGRQSTLAERIRNRSRVMPNGCLLWTGHLDKDGYGGKISIQGVKTRIHRAAYAAAHGPIPEGLSVLHTCDTPACVNPTHLFVGTTGDNMRDKAAKGRAWRPRGEAHPNSKLTDAQVREIRRVRAAGETQESVAQRFGVSQGTVNRVTNLLAWTHVSA